MSTSEIPFLAVGLVFGVGLGAVLAQLGRTRPAPRREIRLTITPNAIPPRRAQTLSVPHGTEHPGPIPGSPDDGALSYGETYVIAPGSGWGTATAPASQNRTRVLSPAVLLPAAVVGVPVGSPRSPASGGSRAIAPDAARAMAPMAAATVGVAVLEAPGGRPDPVPVTERVRATVMAPAPRRAGPARDDSFTTLVRPRPPAEDPRPSLPAGAVATRPAFSSVARPALAPPSAPTLTRPRAASGPDGASDPSPGATEPGAAADPCSGPRRAVEERCALAGVAGEQARRAADSLREAQRAYDVLREKVDRAHDRSDPRHVAEAKHHLHAAFRAASSDAASPEETEAAARAWLEEINGLNNAVREALRVVEGGAAELRERLPALERLAAEADAARIAAENAELGCREAREELAGCEESVTRTRDAVPPVEEEPHPFARVWPSDNPNLPPEPSPADLVSGLPAVVRILRGDRGARERLVATLAAGDPEAAREWHLRVSRLMDAIVGRAIEDGYLDLPDDDHFWRLFDHREARDIVGALSALGFRYDGMGGFADGRVPATRDLSLAVGYAGLDRMRIRTWPRDAEIAALYERAIVASDQWLADQVGDLTLGRMVDALGGRAADLADVWNAWGRVRPALLAS